MGSRQGLLGKGSICPGEVQEQGQHILALRGAHEGWIEFELPAKVYELGHSAGLSRLNSRVKRQITCIVWIIGERDNSNSDGWRTMY